MMPLSDSMCVEFPSRAGRERPEGGLYPQDHPGGHSRPWPLIRCHTRCVCCGGEAPRAEVLKSKEPLIKPRRGAGQKGQRAEAPVKVRPALPRALWSVA